MRIEYSNKTLAERLLELKDPALASPLMLVKATSAANTVRR